ncbi:MAG: DUF1961 family protein [Oscillospiraceae bacterium]|nr:DUF1961 family protein [Oscillospiraceae bacterium]
MKKQLILISTAIIITTGTVCAAPITKMLEAHYNDIKIEVNGDLIEPKDEDGNVVDPFIVDGTTYLPVRAIAEAFDKKVSWHENSSTVIIEDDIQSADNITHVEKKIYEKGEFIYENSLSSESDVADWVMEGQAKVTFPNGRMHMESVLDQSAGQAANFVYWCPQKFEDNIVIEWEFTPLSDEGLAIMFFGANGQDGRDLFDNSLTKRTGEYRQYHSSDINAFHVSYYRRSEPSERELNVANLRKSAGFHMVAQGADPIPTAKYKGLDPYKIKIIKATDCVLFYVNDLEIFRFNDDGSTYGDYIKEGYIGFRQKVPLEAEYANLKVYKIAQ